ncbi:MAG: ADP-ribosyltransferase domain-containing protein [Thalassolituus sp.]|jgi:hypothetical protein
MADFELEDSQGNRYRIRRGAGPQFWHTENLAGGSTLLADELLCNVPVSSIDAAHNHFYSDVLTSLPNRQSSPQGALSDALSSSHLTIEKIGTALVISDDVPDPRNELIVKIRNALATIVAGERAEAAMHTRLLDEENTLTKSMIYTGAFMQGIGSSAWGMVVWLKEVSDVVNPFVKMQHHAKALQAAWESEDFSKTYADTYVKGEKRELVEALGFDPTTITEQQIDEAMAMTSLVMDDPNVRGMLYQFTKDYAEAQHAIEVTNVIGSAVFEIILAIVMAAVTGGVGVVAAVGSKAHLIKKFQKVGDLLQDFAKATRSLKRQAKKRKTKGNQNAALPVEKVEAKKTDAHGAEDGKPSEKKDQDRDDDRDEQDRDKEDDKPGGTAKPVTQSPTVYELIDSELDLSNSLNGLEGEAFINNAKIEYHLSSHMEGVTFEEFLSLQVYTTELYKPMNNGLRGKDPASKIQWSEATQNADSALEKLSNNGLKYEGTVVRGDTFDDGMLEALFPEGGVHSDPAFKSSSSNPEGSFPGNTVTEIRSKNGVHISDISVKPNEEEVLFRPNTKFKVLSRTKTPDGQNYIVLEEI